MNKLINILSISLISGAICIYPAFADGEGATSGDESEVYSGVYNDHQLIPNTMATKCKKSAEDMVKNPQELRDCINRLALKRRDSNAETSREGLKDLQEIKFDQLQEMASLAAAKGAAVADYYAKTAQQTDEANKNAKTTSDVDSAAVNTSAILTSVVNSMRDLYIEQLKYLAISNIENIEKSVLDEVVSLDALKETQKTEENQPETSDATTDADISQTTSTATTTQNKSILMFKNGMCERCLVDAEGSALECRAEACPDGEYADRNDNNTLYKCKNGECEKMNFENEQTDIESILRENASKKIAFNFNSDRTGWEFSSGTCQYCEDGRNYGVNHMVCIYECPPDGKYPLYSDYEDFVVCTNGHCEEVSETD